MLALLLNRSHRVISSSTSAQAQNVEQRYASQGLVLSETRANGFGLRSKNLKP